MFTRCHVFTFIIVLLAYTVSAVAFMAYANKEHIAYGVAPRSVTTIDWGQKAIIVHIDPCLQSKVDPRSVYWTEGGCPVKKTPEWPGLRKPIDDTGIDEQERR